jgi:hypothetical protein
MQVTVNGSKKEIADAIAGLDFEAGKIELSTNGSAPAINGNGKRHSMSLAARKKIAAAQRARLAKVAKKA